jgi:glycerol-3-phosphate dehydrogenase
MIRIGLWLYDHIGGKKPALARGGLGRSAMGAGLKPGLSKGFVYSDAWVDDARLVVLNAMDAAARGPTSGPASRPAPPGGGRPLAGGLTPTQGAAPGDRPGSGARAPWSMPQALGGRDAGGIPDAQVQGGIRLVKGSHIIVPRLYPGDHAFILQKEDGRIVFTIPYQDAFTLVGTTDVLVGEEERDGPNQREEIDYLCETVNSYFEAQVTPDDVVSTYSGVRPLYDDGRQGDHARLCAQTGARAGRRCSIFGGKLTYRRLAEHALEMLAPFLPPMAGSWTGTAALPGGDLDGRDFAAFLESVARWPFLPAATARRMAHAYGTRMAQIMGAARPWPIWARISAPASPRPSCAI